MRDGPVFGVFVEIAQNAQAGNKRDNRGLSRTRPASCPTRFLYKNKGYICKRGTFFIYKPTNLFLPFLSRTYLSSLTDILACAGVSRPASRFLPFSRILGEFSFRLFSHSTTSFTSVFGLFPISDFITGGPHV